MLCAGSARCRTGGSLPSSCLGTRTVVSFLNSVCTRGWGGRSPSYSMALSSRGVPRWCARGLPPLPLLRAADMRCWVGGSSSPYPPLQPPALGAGFRSGGGVRRRSSSFGTPHSTRFMGSPLWFKESPSRGVLPLGLSGVSPCSLAACHGRALLGVGSPSPFPPSSAARIRRARPFGGGPSPPSPRLPGPSPHMRSWGFRPPPTPSVCSRFLWPHGHLQPAQAPR